MNDLTPHQLDIFNKVWNPAEPVLLISQAISLDLLNKKAQEIQRLLLALDIEGCLFNTRCLDVEDTPALDWELERALHTLDSQLGIQTYGCVNVAKIIRDKHELASVFIEFFGVRPRGLDEYDLSCMARTLIRADVGLYGVITCYEPISNSQYMEVANLYFLNKELVLGVENVDSITLSDAIYTSQELIKTYAAQVC